MKSNSPGKEIVSELVKRGADRILFVDISKLPQRQNKGFPNAILIVLVLSRKFIIKVMNTDDYIKYIVHGNNGKDDEFHQKEHQADRLADYASDYLITKGFSAYSQSEKNILQTGFYDEKTRSTPLPHKTIAGLAGLGWIGNHNLLIMPEFGSAVCMSTVLMDAPLPTVHHEPSESRCGDCSLCQEICPVEAIQGNHWNINVSRDELVDVKKCSKCLKCLSLCHWTQKYLKHNDKLDPQGLKRRV